MNVRLTVEFAVEPVVINVDADSIEDAWRRREELAAGVVPAAWRASAVSVEADDTGDVADRVRLTASCYVGLQPGDEGVILRALDGEACVRFDRDASERLIMNTNLVYTDGTPLPDFDDDEDTSDTPDPIVPDAIWCDHGDGRQRIRIIDRRRDGRVVFERIAGAPDHALRREVTVTEAQLRRAFEPTGEWDFGTEEGQ